ncbi:major capsid protein [Polaromonas eurypsychrophila]|uniref:Major capsid protein n=2 Tax=Polaromonas eurypsychrophila TaxID=1614635 RepID=A0A916SK29_9BURK|nr:major capsid protein [Polaromonas eurypsychrophila]
MGNLKKAHSMTIAAIREQRATKVADMRRLLTTAEGEKRSLNAAEQSAFDAIKTQVQDLEGQEGRAQFLEDMERRAEGSPVGDKSFNTLQRAVNVVEVIRAQMEGRSLSGAALEYSQETERRTGRKAEGCFVPMAALEKRVNTTTSAAQLATTESRPDQYIDTLRNSLLARKLGARVLSNLTGAITVPKYGTGTTSGWVAENTALTPGDMAFSAVTLAPKHAGGISEMSRGLIQSSSPDIEQLIRDDLSAMLAKAIDSALIMGGGTNEPTGVLATAGIQTANLATLSWPNIVVMLQKLELVNATPNAWLMGTKPKAKLMSILDTTGLPAKFLDNGVMANIPAFSTNQVADKTSVLGKVILGDWSQVLLGIYSELDILVNPFAETAYSKGNVLVRAMSTVGIAVRHPQAFVVAEDVAI